MKQVRCSRGHFYDADKYDSCPHCANIHDSLTPPNVTMTKVPNDDGVTVTLHDEGKEQGNSVVSEVITPPQSVSPAWENKRWGMSPRPSANSRRMATLWSGGWSALRVRIAAKITV